MECKKEKKLLFNLKNYDYGKDYYGKEKILLLPC